MTDPIKQTKRVYYTILLLFWFATGLPMALSVLLMLARGLTLYQTSILLGIYAITIVLLEVPTGGLADAIGRKKVTLLAYSFMLFSSIVLLLSFSFAAFLLGWVLYGIGRALASGALDAWFIDRLQALDPHIDLQCVMAQSNTFNQLGLGLGFLAGPAFSQLMHNLPPDGSTAILTPYAVPFALTAVIKVILIIVAFVLVKEEGVKKHAFTFQQALSDTRTIIKTGFTLSRRSKVIPLLMGAAFAMGIAMSNLETFSMPFFSDLMRNPDGSTLLFGVIEGGSFAIGVLGNQLSIPLKRWRGGRLGWMCGLSQGLCGVFMVFLAVQTQLPSGIAFYWLVGFAIAAHDYPYLTLLNNEIPAVQRSAMLSISSMVSHMGLILGSLLMGYLAQVYSIAAVWAIDGLIVIGSVLFYVRIEKVLRRTEHGLPSAG